MTTTSSGACLCGAVAYIYTGEPVMRAVCYCSPCRKISGGTNTVDFVIPEEDFKLTRGQLRSFSKEHEYGMTLTVLFCSECRTTLWKEATAPQFKGVKLVQARTLSDAKKLDEKLNAELYMPERASWLHRLIKAAQEDVTAQEVENAKTGYPPCDALIQANLSHLVHLADSPLYPTLVNGSWAPDTRKSPFCFVLPTTTEEVSQTIIALRDAGSGAGDWHIAVRSGGHATDHSNNIDTGVTIDLTQINATTYNRETNVASVGTGARWGAVYADLLEHDVSVMGGREGVVGVGGLVLGGGVSWYTPKRAFACDSVVNYEVVLGNGSIVNANPHSHRDLWRALKGGGANFGIVTRFDMEPFPAQNITKATTVISMEHLDEVLDAVVGFTSLDQSFEDNYLLTVFNYDQASDSTAITLTEVNTANDLNSSAFHSVQKIPTLRRIPAKSMSLAESSDGSSLGDEMRTVGAGPVTVANDHRILRFIVDQYNGFVKDIKEKVNPANFSTIFDLQPMPSRVADYSVSKGGNMLGLERNNHDRVIAAVGAILFGGQYSDQDVALIYQLSAAMNDRIIAHAKSLGVSEDWVYLAYSDAQQDPLGSYGQTNVNHIRQVAHKYDPKGFFQKRVPGGFKIDRVETGKKRNESP